MRIIQELLAEATEVCITCTGNGLIPYGHLKRPCPDCRGTGRMLTDDGHELVKFCQRWLRGYFADEDHGHSLH